MRGEIVTDRSQREVLSTLDRAYPGPTDLGGRALPDRDGETIVALHIDD
jgi:hypothetical protein